ncbi:NADPH-dependent FMN reductase [Caulobacter soli]|uniref:NADPH-dependent FMN reductase n=1 Tax=Caulobacter soli TaxID=2708539 RepID=UPI0013ED5A8E|nr:NAD(P)H-dependent oxidoreductase [Caulobacter soli]
MSSAPPLIVGFGGTTRPGSTTERLVSAVLDRCAALGAEVQLFGGAFLSALPHFAPDAPARTAEQIRFVAAVRRASGLVIGSPGYHGGISGLVKNAIDLLEDTRLDARCYFDGLPVGLVVSTAGWQAGGVTLSSMRDVVHALRGWPTPVGISVNTVAQRPFLDSGDLDEAILGAVEEQARQLMRLAPLAGRLQVDAA